MVRTTITPEQDSIQLAIPQDYVGKELEVLIFAKKEVDDKSEPLAPKETQPDMPPVERKKASDFKGILSPEVAAAMQKYVKKSRNQWK